MSGWISTTLGEIADGPQGFIDGPFGSNLPASDYVDAGVPVIRGSNLTLGLSRFNANGFVFVSQQTAERLRRSSAKANDIVFTKKGTIGQTGLVPNICKFPVFILSSNQMRLRVDLTKADPLYVYYYVSQRTSVDKVLRDSEVTGVPKTNLTYFRTFPIALPSLREQRAIASTLGALDDKIDLNRRMNDTLETMARALFNDWFVDFGPTRAKMEGRARYLATEIWSLFPDRLDDEGKPAGWRNSTVKTEFKLTMGQSPPGDTYNDIGDGLPFFQGRTDFGERYPKRRIYCTEPTRIAEVDDTLVSVRAPVGDLNMAWERCCIGRGVAAVRHSSAARSYTYYALNALQSDLAAFEHTGTVFGAINKVQFEILKVIAPREDIIDAFEQMVSNLDDGIRANVAENSSLISVRDLILPKLMSGEIQLRDAEKALGAVA